MGGEEEKNKEEEKGTKEEKVICENGEEEVKKRDDKRKREEEKDEYLYKKEKLKKVDTIMNADLKKCYEKYKENVTKQALYILRIQLPKIILLFNKYTNICSSAGDTLNVKGLYDPSYNKNMDDETAYFRATYNQNFGAENEKKNNNTTSNSSMQEEQNDMKKQIHDGEEKEEEKNRQIDTRMEEEENGVTEKLQKKRTAEEEKEEEEEKEKEEKEQLLSTMNDDISSSSLSIKRKEKEETKEEEEEKSLDNMRCKKSILEESVRIKKRANELIEMMSCVKLFVQMHVPPIQDGNNFGVAVQQEAIQLLNRVEESGVSLIESMTGYFRQRGDILKKIEKYKNAENLKNVYKNYLREFDEKEWMYMKMTYVDMRNNYTILYDLICKNFDRIVTPRGAHSECNTCFFSTHSGGTHAHTNSLLQFI